MDIEKVTVNFVNSKKPQTVFHVYVTPSGEKKIHGEFTEFLRNGRIKERKIYKHDNRDGLEVLNYKHDEGDFDKRYLFTTFKTGVQNGVQVYFFKH